VLHAPIWVVMQLGAFGAAPATAAVAFASGRRPLAFRLLASGTLTWMACKGVKVVVGRGRPAELLESVRIIGNEQTGGGYPSGHAAVSAALASAAGSSLPGGGRMAAGVAATVAMSRVYVGAHLPLDVAGGAAVGLAVDGAVAALLTRAGRPS
jgi:undecaprenyl-diphosphatase